MMGVYIKGMEMPRIGESVTIYPDGRAVRYDTYNGGTIRGEAVPVPPHGRLIDADATKVSFVYARETGDWSVPQMRTVLEIIEAVPTIIPAEEGGCGRCDHCRINETGTCRYAEEL